MSGLEAECARAASEFLLCEERADARLIATIAVIEYGGYAIYLHLWRRISVTMQLPSSATSRTGAAIFNLIRRKPMCKEKTTSEKVSDAAKSTGKKVKWAAQDAGKAVGDAARATGKAVSNAAKATGKATEDAIKK